MAAEPRSGEQGLAIARLVPIGLAAILMACTGCAGEGAQGRPWVHKLTIDGVHHIDRGDLVGKLAVEETSWFPFLPKHYLDPFALQLDRKRVEAYYHAHGFFRARLVSVDVKPRNKDSVDVKLVVDEGPATKIEDVKVTGLDPIGAEGPPILAAFKLERGQVFDDEKLGTAIERMLAELKALGYAWANVEGGADVDRDRSVARLHVSVTPGPKAFISKITSTGDFSKVSPAQIQIHSGLALGQLVTPDDLEAARGKIYNLGIFSSVKIGYQHLPNQTGAAEITLNLQEGPLRELRLGAGLGFEFQRTEVRLRLIYTRRNLFGGLRTLRFTLEPAYVAIPAFWDIKRHGPAGKAEAQFTQPDLLLPLDQLKITVGYDLGIDYAYQYHGPRTQVAYARPFWRDRLQLSVSHNFQFLMFFNTDPAILANPEQAHRLLGYIDPYRLAWWQEDVILDLRDRAMDARSGGYLALSVEEGGAFAGGAFQYEKLLPEGRGYIPFGKRVVIAGRLQFGQMFVQGDLGSPITRRFYLGGPDSHRGFSYNRLSPQVPSGLPNVSALPIGGDQMLLGQIEARVAIVRLFGFWLEAAAFVDAGDVAAPSCQSQGGTQTACSALLGNMETRINLRRLHYATGGGLRYKTVIGTIRADLGVRLNRLAPTEADGTPNPDPNSRFAVHISIGEPF